MAKDVLSQEDIQRLMTDRSVKTQIALVEKLAEQYTAEGSDSMNSQQTAIANDIFRLLLERAGMIVRAMLAMQLSQSDKLPPDLARQIASDVDEVAGPILQYSEALSDADLLNIIHSMVDDKKLEAIAKRDTVSEAVASELINTNIETVVNALVHNEGANITAQSFEKIAKDYHDNAELMESIFQRNSLPVVVVDKIIERLSGTVRKRLEEKYGDLAEMKAMRETLDNSLELARIKIMGFKSSDKELAHLIKWLNDNNTLSPFSALSMGNLQLFEISLARLLHIPLANMHILLKDSSGFKTVYKQANLPPNLFEATELAVNSIRQLEEENMKKKGHKEIPSPSQIIERIKESSKNKKIEGVDHLCAMIQHIATQRL